MIRRPAPFLILVALLILAAAPRPAQPAEDVKPAAAKLAEAIRKAGLGSVGGLPVGFEEDRPVDRAAAPVAGDRTTGPRTRPRPLPTRASSSSGWRSSSPRRPAATSASSRRDGSSRQSSVSRRRPVLIAIDDDDGRKPPPERGGAAWGGHAFLPVEPGETPVITVRNTTGKRAMVAVLVDGVNILGKRRELPDEHCRAWVIDPGVRAKFRGWYSGEEKAKLL